MKRPVNPAHATSALAALLFVAVAAVGSANAAEPRNEPTQASKAAAAEEEPTIRPAESPYSARPTAPRSPQVPEETAEERTPPEIQPADTTYSPRPTTHGGAWRQRVEYGIGLDMQGRHDEADAVWDALEAQDGGDPEPWLRRVDTTYWRHWYDEGQGLAEDEIRSMLDKSKSLAEKRLKADRKNLRARWLLGEVLMQEARFEGQRGNYMKAGTMGEKGRKQLEALLEDQPGNLEARYTLGLYYYFASLMPDAVQSMSWLWFIPKGDRDTGLALLDQARTGSTLYGPPASMVLMAIHTYHSPPDIPTALGIATELHESYPTNAILHFELLEVLLKARRHDELLAKAIELEQRRDEPAGIAGRAMLATIWRARSAVDRGDAAAARAIAFELDTDDPKLPDWGAPWLWAVRGQVLDLEGDRAGALAAYQKVIDGSDEKDYNARRPRRLASAGIAAPYEPGLDLDGPVIGGGD